MKKFSKKGVLLFAAAMALCAFAMPSMAPAASFSPVGLETTLHSADVGFTSANPALGRINSNCTRSNFTVRVTSAALLDVIGATFGGHCTAQFLDVAGAPICTSTAQATTLPYRGTAPSATNITIDGVRIDVGFENTPGNANCTTAGLTGGSIIITGNLTGGVYNNGPRTLVYSNAPGLVSHSAATGANGTPVAVRATFTSTGNLQVLP
jgi:hypothetical protein